jgi:transcriptional regulator with XRE-family HTH domain
MENNFNDIRSRIQKRRMELEMSYQDLSDSTGISKSSLQRYETGYIGSIGIDRIEVLAKALNVTPSYLMGWDELKKNDGTGTPAIFHMREGGTEIEKYSADEVEAAQMKVYLAKSFPEEAVKEIYSYLEYMKIKYNASGVKL